MPEHIRKDRHAGGGGLVLPPAVLLLLALAMPAYGLDTKFSKAECCLDEQGSSCCRDIGCTGNNYCDENADCSGNTGSMTVCAGVNTDDSHARGTTSPSYPGAYSSCSEAATTDARKGNSTSQRVDVQLLRWPTGDVLNGETITSCSLRVNVPTTPSDTDARDWVCEWYAWDGTCDAGDWSASVGSTALSVDITTITTGDHTYSLTDCAANVNTTPGGYTGLRCGISGTGTTGNNIVTISAMPAAPSTTNNPGARLVVGVPDPPTATPTDTAPPTHTFTPTPPPNTNTPTPVPDTPTITPTFTHTPTPAPTNTPTFGVLDSIPSAPEGWWYDVAKCNGPRLVTVGSVQLYAGVCERAGGRIQDTIEVPASYAGGGIKIRPSAYKLAATSDTGTLTLSYAAQCVNDGDAPSSTFGTPQTVSWSVGSYAKNDRMAGVSALITPSGTCSGLSSVIVEGTVTSAPSKPSLYPLGPMEIEVAQ